MKHNELEKNISEHSVDGRVHTIQDRRHRYTISYALSDVDGVLRVTAAGAFCSAKDIFNRKLGRLISLSRLWGTGSTSNCTPRGQCGEGPVHVSLSLKGVMDQVPSTGPEWRELDHIVTEMFNVR